MKLFRFMSKLEFIKLCNGENIVNNTVHKARTTSIGFCFLDYDEYKPECALHFLTGIVNTEMCVVLETDKKLLKATGIYAKPLSVDEFKEMTLIEFLDFSNVETIEVNEYSTKEYNKKDFKILKYCECYQPNIFNTGDFNWVDYHD